MVAYLALLFKTVHPERPCKEIPSVCSVKQLQVNTGESSVLLAAPALKGTVERSQWKGIHHEEHTIAHIYTVGIAGLSTSDIKEDPSR